MWIKGKVGMANPTTSPFSAHFQSHEVGSRHLPPTPLRRGSLAPLQTIRESPSSTLPTSHGGLN